MALSYQTKFAIKSSDLMDSPDEVKRKDNLRKMAIHSRNYE
jgi:hypothetical protein